MTKYLDIMIRLCLLLLLSLCSFMNCIGQDTLRPEKSIHYSSKKEPDRSKDFASRVKYAKEIIVYSKTHQRIDYCYYYDKERDCYGCEYKITSDTTFSIIDDFASEQEIWKYKKRGNLYEVERINEGICEFGVASSIIPFTRVGDFITSTENRSDTLWITNYGLDKANEGNIVHSFRLYETKIEGRIYNSNEVDEIPTLLNGNILDEIKPVPSIVCVGQSPPPPDGREVKLKCIISKEGKILNIREANEIANSDPCDFSIQDAIRLLSRIGKVKPAKIHDKTVNVYWTVRAKIEN